MWCARDGGIPGIYRITGWIKYTVGDVIKPTPGVEVPPSIDSPAVCCTPSLAVPHISLTAFPRPPWVGPRHWRSVCATLAPPAKTSPQQIGRTRSRGPSRDNYPPRGKWKRRRPSSSSRGRQSVQSSPRCCTGRKAYHGVAGERYLSTPQLERSRPNA